MEKGPTQMGRREDRCFQNATCVPGRPRKPSALSLVKYATTIRLVYRQRCVAPAQLMIRVCVAGVTGWTGQAGRRGGRGGERPGARRGRLALGSRELLVGRGGARRRRRGCPRRLHACRRRPRERSRGARAARECRRRLERPLSSGLRRDRRARARAAGRCHRSRQFLADRRAASALRGRASRATWRPGR